MSMIFKTMIDIEKSAYFIVANIQGEERPLIVRAALIGNGDMVIYPINKELLEVAFGKTRVSPSDRTEKSFMVYTKQSFGAYSCLQVRTPSAITLIKRERLISISLLDEINYHSEPIVL